MRINSNLFSYYFQNLKLALKPGSRAHIIASLFPLAILAFLYICVYTSLLGRVKKIVQDIANKIIPQTIQDRIFNNRTNPYFDPICRKNFDTINREAVECIFTFLDPISIMRFHSIKKGWNEYCQKKIPWKKVAEYNQIPYLEGIPFSIRKQVIKCFFSFGEYRPKTHEFIARRQLSYEDCKKIVKRFPNTYVMCLQGKSDRGDDLYDVIYHNKNKMIGILKQISYSLENDNFANEISKNCIRINLIYNSTLHTRNLAEQFNSQIGSFIIARAQEQSFAPLNHIFFKYAFSLSSVFSFLDLKSIQQCLLVEKQWNSVLEEESSLWQDIAKQNEIHYSEKAPFSIKEQVTNCLFPFGIYHPSSHEFVKTRELTGFDYEEIIKRFPDTSCSLDGGKGHTIIIYHLREIVGVLKLEDITFSEVARKLLCEIDKYCHTIKFKSLK